MKTLFPRLEWGLLTAALLYASYFQLSLPGKVPSNADYLQASEILKKESLPGDMVLLHPFWAEKARLFVPPAMPVVGFQGQEKEKFEEFQRIWVLSAPKLPGNPPEPLTSAHPLTPPQELGALTLSLYKNPHHRPLLFSAAQELENADVSIELPNGRRESCSRQASAFRCPLGATVAQEWHEVLFQPQLCLTVHPPAQNGKLVLTFPRVPEAGELALKAGYIWDRGYFKDARLAPIRVKAEDASGNTLTQIELAPGQEGYHQGKPYPLSNEGELRLTLDTANPELRETCVQLQVFAPRGDSE